MEDRFTAWQAPKIVDGQLTKWNWIVQNIEKFSLGKKTDIGAFTYINALVGVEIGDNVQIGSHCSIYSVSTIDNKIGPVRLLENCKIGSHSVIMPGVTIGENAVIGAFSFVTEDIPANTMAYGIPAKVVNL